MKTSSIAILIVAAFAVGCETTGQKMEDLHAEQEVKEEQTTLMVAHVQANLRQCREHLHAESHPREWKKFWQAHRDPSDGEPTGMDDEELGACLAVSTPAK